MPKNVLDKVWAYFDAAGPLTGAQWPIEYRWEEQRRLDLLRAMGVRAFPSLVYPHRPAMAGWLNAWAADFAASQPDVVHTATFFPEPSAPADVRNALVAGARLFKSHVQVGAYDPRDPLLDEVWGQLADAGVPVVVHCGGGPVPGPFTGPAIFAEVLARHPRLTAVIAHMGMPEYAEFLALARSHPPDVAAEMILEVADADGGHVPNVATSGYKGKRTSCGSQSSGDVTAWPRVRQHSPVERLVGFGVVGASFVRFVPSWRTAAGTQQ